MMHVIYNLKVSNRTTPLSDTPSKFRGFVLDAGATVHPVERTFRGKLVVVGDSITAGWGNTGTCCGQPGARSEPCAEDGTQSYGPLAARELVRKPRLKSIVLSFSISPS
jgi:hypothetical protein